MKKIAFFVQHMICGGVEKALLSLTDELAKTNKFDITIYCAICDGEFISKVSDKIRLKPIPMDEGIRKSLIIGGYKINIQKCLNEGKYLSAAKYLLRYALDKGDFSELNVDFDKIPKLDEKYDIAVNYHIHSPFLVRYLDEKVEAEKKLSWIHNDFTTTEYDIKKLQGYLEGCHSFYCVSKQLVDEFTDIFPQYKDKTHPALNITPVDETIAKADEFYPDEYSSADKAEFKLLTVGRLEAQKGYDLAIEVCKRLKADGYSFKWFVLGDGSEKKHLQALINKSNVNDYFELLGVKINPYPYFKNCDLYIQTSRHEGYVTTVTEAKLFNLPVVCTNVSGAKEQLVDGITGSIAEIDANSIYTRVKELLDSSELRNKYSENLSLQVKGNDTTYLSVFEG